MRLGQVLVVGALALDQVGHGIEPQPVDADVEPEAHDAQHFRQHARVVEVQVRLVRVEAVPEIGLGDRVPGPVRLLGVEEDDARVRVASGRCRTRRRSRASASPAGAWRARWNQGCWSEVWLMTSSVMTRSPRACASRTKRRTSRQGAVVGMDAAVVGDVVAVVAPRRRVEGQQPERVDAELGDVVELREQPGEVADAVVVGVEEGLHVQLVDDRVVVPERVVARMPPARRGAVGRACLPAPSRRPASRAIRRSPPGGRARCPKGSALRVEPHAAALAVPGEAVAAHQVLRLQRRIVRQAPLPQRQFHRRFLHVARVEADGAQHHVAAVRRGLAVPEHLVVEGIVEGHAHVGLPARSSQQPELRRLLPAAPAGGDVWGWGRDVPGGRGQARARARGRGGPPGASSRRPTRPCCRSRRS